MYIGKVKNTNYSNFILILQVNTLLTMKGKMNTNHVALRKLDFNFSKV